MTEKPCPICLEVPSSSSAKVVYATASNHSWSNTASRCDGHDICLSCLTKHIEVQVLSEGRSNIRCPGIGCKYHLLQQDIEQAGPEAKVLEVWKQLREQSCQERLWEAVNDAAKKDSAAARWVVQHCQPCPTCFTLARKEQGCNHIVCRCGTDFCFACGAPHAAGCICHYLDAACRDGDLYFAAWLRSAFESPESCEWLWEELRPEVEEDENGLMDRVLAVWLWAAGAADHLQLVTGSPPVPPPEPRHPALTPLQWTAPNFDSDGYFFDDERDFDYDFDEWCCLSYYCYDGPWREDQPIGGHLRKDIDSFDSKRTQHRRVQRAQGAASNCQPKLEDGARRSTMPAATPPRAMKPRTRRNHRSTF
eukprot:CAMPEP_0178431096 /NCGR_PEP_ID=MMETSP0689_2-20121128/31662_1 /TAXON_ID=160604 /ORGANISM="Amphidinium massartii, Strain CS-259" /LENGTH=363 /DNA_ID=CAMNT_0020052979 /DNA_START=122 /DNA_END=1213 /DNA_ORIENTATION=-